MSNGADDPHVSRLLSLSGHELSNAVSVALGYIKFLFGERAGPLNEQQRKWLEEVNKACARLAGITDEMRELGKLEARKIPLHVADVDLRALLAEAADNIPPVPERDSRVTLTTASEPAVIKADRKRLKSAITSIIWALRRELVTSAELQVRQSVGAHDGSAVAWIVIGGADHIDTLASTDVSRLTPFDEWRGGCGLSLPLARCILNAHKGYIWSPADGLRTGAVVAIPLA
jgi:signal transduction histidine kinase